MRHYKTLSGYGNISLVGYFNSPDQQNSLCTGLATEDYSWSASGDTQQHKAKKGDGDDEVEHLKSKLWSRIKSCWRNS